MKIIKLRDKFKECRNQTLKLVEGLKIEDFNAQPVIDVSPPKWHLGHTTWFFENFILKANKSSYRLFNQDFPYVFNSYYQSQGDRLQRDKRSSLIRPSTEEIIRYRHYVDQHIIESLENNELNEKQLQFLEIGINHEQQHQELLITDIKAIFYENYFKPAYQNPIPREAKKANAINWLKVEEGLYEIGHEGESFCFDNELGRHRVFIHEFEAADRLITNGEFIEFIEDEAYKRPELWLSEGWDWVEENRVEMPAYWEFNSGEFRHFTSFGMQAVNPEETLCHISFYEAEAFARWSGKRLLTEFEWEVLAQNFGKLNDQNHFQEAELFHLSTATDNQLFGSAWEWTNSAYLPYPGYQQEEGALGEYNGKFMVNQMVLRGGSCATPQSHFRPTYRNFFHPHLRWQFTGIRLAK